VLLPFPPNGHGNDDPATTSHETSGSNLPAVLSVFEPVHRSPLSHQADTMPSEIDAVEENDDYAASTPKRSHKSPGSKKTKAVKVVTTLSILDLSVASPTPLRLLAPVVSLLVASLASFRLQLSALDEPYLFLHDERFSAFQGQILSLLSSFNLNASFGKSDSRS
jgi:hypothetical protein